MITTAHKRRAIYCVKRGQVGSNPSVKAAPTTAATKSPPLSVAPVTPPKTLFQPPTSAVPPTVKPPPAVVLSISKPPPEKLLSAISSFEKQPVPFDPNRVKVFVEELPVLIAELSDITAADVVSAKIRARFGDKKAQQTVAQIDKFTAGMQQLVALLHQHGLSLPNTKGKTPEEALYALVSLYNQAVEKHNERNRVPLPSITLKLPPKQGALFWVKRGIANTEEKQPTQVTTTRLPQHTPTPTTTTQPSQLISTPPTGVTAAMPIVTWQIPAGREAQRNISTVVSSIAKIKPVADYDIREVERFVSLLPKLLQPTGNTLQDINSAWLAAPHFFGFIDRPGVIQKINIKNLENSMRSLLATYNAKARAYNEKVQNEKDKLPLVVIQMGGMTIGPDVREPVAWKKETIDQAIQQVVTEVGQTNEPINQYAQKRYTALSQEITEKLRQGILDSEDVQRTAAMLVCYHALQRHAAGAPISAEAILTMLNTDNDKNLSANEMTAAWNTVAKSLGLNEAEATDSGIIRQFHTAFQQMTTTQKAMLIIGIPLSLIGAITTFTSENKLMGIIATMLGLAGVIWSLYSSGNLDRLLGTFNVSDKAPTQPASGQAAAQPVGE